MKLAIDNRDNPKKLEQLREQVKKFSLQFPLPSDK